jgi:uncharacterized membrane protein required for colicin V production
MDIVDLIRSVTAADILLLLFCAAAFVFGFFQGAMRGLMVLGTWVFAFVLAANLWSPLGRELSRYWTQFVPEYSQMLAFGITFVVALVLANIAVAVFTRRAPLLGRWPIADEILGGFLGLSIALLIVAGTLVGLDTFYGTRPLEVLADVSWVTGLHTALSDSVVGGWIRDTIVPSVVILLSPLIPAEIRQLIVG